MKNTFRILCLEDDAEDFDIINYTLKSEGLSFTSIRVDSREKFIQALDQFHPDVILSDHALPKFSSNEALDVCKAKGINVPFILVTGAMSDEFAVSCLKRGADDYVLKSNLTRLPGIIENTLTLKKAEEARVKAARDLAKRNEELSKINRELDSFVYSVSHNLRAPLRSVLGLLNLAKFETDPAAIRNYHDMMEANIHKLDMSLVDLLEYARNSRQDIRVEKVSLKKIIDDNLEKMQFMPGFEVITKEVLIKENVDFYSDEYRLSVIFNNLISNSIKYADKKKSNSFIKVSATVENDHAIIEFQDNGIGIDEHMLPKIFDMFFRATEKKEGVGLGLYIVKEAVQILHGKIEVNSNEGEGTYFRMDIPNRLQKTSTTKDALKNTLLVDKG